MDFEIYIDNSIVNDNRIVYFENFLLSNIRHDLTFSKFQDDYFLPYISNFNYIQEVVTFLIESLDPFYIK